MMSAKRVEYEFDDLMVLKAQRLVYPELAGR